MFYGKLKICIIGILLFLASFVFGFDEQSLRYKGTAGYFLDDYDFLVEEPRISSYDKGLHLILYPSDLAGLISSGTNLINTSDERNYTGRVTALLNLEKSRYGIYFHSYQYKTLWGNNTDTTTTITTDNNQDSILGNSTSDTTTTTSQKSKNVGENKDTAGGITAGFDLDIIKLSAGYRYESTNRDGSNNDFTETESNSIIQTSMTGIKTSTTQTTQKDNIFYPQENHIFFVRSNLDGISMLAKLKMLTAEKIQRDDYYQFQDLNPSSTTLKTTVTQWGDNSNTSIDEKYSYPIVSVTPGFKIDLGENFATEIFGDFGSASGDESNKTESARKIERKRPDATNTSTAWTNYTNTTTNLTGNRKYSSYGLRWRNYINVGNLNTGFGVIWLKEKRNSNLTGNLVSTTIDIEDDGNSSTYNGYSGGGNLNYNDGKQTVTQTTSYDKYNTESSVNTVSFPVGIEYELSKGISLRFGYTYRISTTVTKTDINQTQGVTKTKLELTNPGISDPPEQYSGSETKTNSSTISSDTTISQTWVLGIGYQITNSIGVDLATNAFDKIELSTSIRF